MLDYLNNNLIESLITKDIHYSFPTFVDVFLGFNR